MNVSPNLLTPNPLTPNPLSLYIHVPFCKQKCNYCDFVSYAGKEDLIDEYVETLTRELELLRSTCLPAGTAFHDQLSTIFFGGGTPTLLSPKHLEMLLSLLIMRPIINKNIEVSIEANPGTADKNKLKALRQLGINRLSIGAQSFNDQHLKTLGRIHDSKEIFRIYDDARTAGFDNINLDLMFALPGQTLNEWRKDLETAIQLKPEHLSAYSLQIEAGTPFELYLPNEDDLPMYEHTIETLTAAGYHHYEISNFAKPGFECRHNIVYWRNGNYLGIGAGAHSHINGHRWANPDSLEAYMRTALGERRNEVRDAGCETIFMGLRLLDGLEAEKFACFEKEVKELIEEGLLERLENKYKLTRRGLYLANEVFQKFV